MTETEQDTSTSTGMTTKANADKLVWQKDPLDPNSPSVHMTEGGGLGLTVSGRTIVLPVEVWHSMATTGFKRFEPDKRTTFVIALTLLQNAYRSFCDIGQKELFLRIAESIAQENWTLFFGSFGNDKGCYLDVKASDVPGEMVLNFGVRSAKRGWWQRIKDAISGFNKDPEYEIHLSPEEVVHFKSLVIALNADRAKEVAHD